VRRTLLPLHLTKSPLVFVLGQVRFEPILAIDSFVPSIQDALRRKEFTGLIQRSMGMTKVEGDQLVTEKIPQWEFQDAARARAFLLDRQSLTLETTNYTSFEDFARDVQIGLEIVEQHARPQTVQRIGLRYIDLIRAADGAGLDRYVCPALRGVQLHKYGKRLGQSHETIVATGDKRRLVVRYTEAAQGMPLPLDLLPINLAFRRPVSLNEPFGVLDTDHYEQLPGVFATQRVLDGIAGLHDVLDQVFRDLVNPEALKEWE
jgi:uncharacterized protein (TIGR04255 family)